MLPPVEPSDQPAKIAVVQCKALGDFLVLLPALCALKQAYPGVELVYLGREWHREFAVPERTPIDRTIAVPDGCGLFGSEKCGEAEALFFRKMRAEHFDAAVHFQGDGVWANPFLVRLGATVTVGMCSGAAPAIDRSIPYVHYHHEVLRALEIVGLLGADGVPREHGLTLAAEDVAEAARFRREYGLERFAVLHPGADDPRRRWPLQHFTVAGDFLCDQGLSVVITGASREAALVLELQERMRGRAVDAAGALSLGGLAALLAEAVLALCSDTGPLHLARAVGCPTVGLHWLPNLINWGPLTRGRHRVGIGTRLDCPGCGIVPMFPYPFEPVSPACAHLFSFVEDVAPAPICAEMRDMMRHCARCRVTSWRVKR